MDHPNANVNKLINEKEIYRLKKENLISAGRTLEYGLVNEDRKILKIFFGFQNGFGLNRECKKTDNIALYIKETLFGKDDNEAQFDETSVPNGSIPTIFPIFGEKWFKIGITLTESEMCAIIRSYQSFSRFFITDFSFKRLQAGSRILISGPSKYWYKY